MFGLVRVREAALLRAGMGEGLPDWNYPEQLPVVARREDIVAAISDHQVVVSETGSGKTTQLPKICLEIGRGRDGRTCAARGATHSGAS